MVHRDAFVKNRGNGGDLGNAGSSASGFWPGGVVRWGTGLWDGGSCGCLPVYERRNAFGPGRITFYEAGIRVTGQLKPFAATMPQPVIDDAPRTG